MPRFHLAADVFIERPVEQVRAFFSDVNSAVIWDRSVCKVIAETPGPLAVGSRFTTIGPSRGGREGKRSAYRVVAVDGDESKAALDSSPVFKTGVWTMRLVPKDGGTRIECDMEITTSWRHAFIGVLLSANRKAIATDLVFLKRAIEHGEVAKR